MATTRGTKLALTAAILSVTGSAAFAQQHVGISIGVRENTAATTIGAASAANGSIEWVNANGVQVLADGLYHDVTFTLGTDPTTYFAGTAQAGQVNNQLDGAFVGLEHLRIVNSEGITKPISIFIDDIVTSNGTPTTLTDFSSIPTTIANNTSNVLFREPSISGSTTPNFARNYLNSFVTNVQPDGTTDAAKQAGRINTRFNTPEVVSSTTGWGRAIASSTNAAIPANPVIYGVGSTLTMRIAIVVNEPQYGFVGADTGNFDWFDDTGANWGKGPTAGSINAPNSTSATALFDEPLPTSGEPTPRTVNLNFAASVQNLQFTTQVPHTITGESTLKITRSAIDIVPTISVEAGQHVVSVPVNFTSGSTAAVQATYTPTIWVSENSGLTLTQSPLVDRLVLATGGTPTNSLTKRGGGRLTLPDVDADSITLVKGTLEMAPTTTNTLATLTLGSTIIPNSGGRASISPTGEGVVKTVTTVSVVANTSSTLASSPTSGGDLAVGTINVGQNSKLSLDLGGKSALRLSALGLNVTASVVTATLDLGDDGVLLDYTSAATPASIRGNILLAYAGGAWTGKGIGSSLLPGAGKYGIGTLDLLTGATFMGRTAPDDTTLGIRYTLKGDGNLDGTVNFDDLLALAQNYDPTYDPNANPPKLWINGDSDYNGIVNFDDLLSLAQNYGGNALSADTAASFGGSFAADWALAQSLVPEPTSLAAIAGLALMGRRRRD